MRAAHWHTFQVLTKRADRLAELAPSLPWPDNVWMGVSIEKQSYAWRIDCLREVPASVRFLSCEPLLGPLSLDLDGVHWVIAGGESGPGARAMKMDWARSIRDQCTQAACPTSSSSSAALSTNGAKTGPSSTANSGGRCRWRLRRYVS